MVPPFFFFFENHLKKKKNYKLKKLYNWGNEFIKWNFKITIYVSLNTLNMADLVIFFLILILSKSQIQNLLSSIFFGLHFSSIIYFNDAIKISNFTISFFSFKIHISFEFYLKKF